MDEIGGQKQMSHDSFCWSCHRDEPSLFCSKCVRSFHTSPLCSHSKKLSIEAIETWCCPECIKIQEDQKQNGANQIDVLYLNQLLKTVLDLMLEDDTIKLFKDPVYSKSVKFPIDLITIRKKLKSSEYSCLKEFHADVEWIVHNTKIQYGPENEMVKATKRLLDETKRQLDSIQICHQCYFRANLMVNDWFAKPCEKPHLLIWAKQKSYPFWPAKLMNVDVVKRSVSVHFFGDHSKTNLTPEDCLMFSNPCPSTNIRDHKFELEANVYIKNIIEKFGAFNFAEDSTPLQIAHIKRHFYDQIPGAWNKDEQVPPAIPKLTAAPITARRSTHSGAKIPKPHQTKPFAGSQIVTRRMSVIDPKNDKNWEKIEENRQTVTIETAPIHKYGIPTEVIDYSGFIEKEKGFDHQKKSMDSGRISPKKRKAAEMEGTLPNMNLKSEPTETMTNSINNETLFKVPAPFQKPRKTPSSASKVSDLNDSKSKFDGIAKKLPLLPSVATPMLTTLSNAVMEKNTQLVKGCLRSSLADTLNEFFEVSNPTVQIEGVKKQMEMARTKSNSLIESLRTKITEKNDKVNSLIDNQNKLAADKEKIIEQLNKNIEVLEAKQAQLIKNLREANTLNAELKINFKATKQNNTNINSRSSELKGMNQQLMQALDEMKIKNTNLVIRIKEQEDKHIKEKQTFLTKCAAEIDEIKKTKWCFICKKPGGRHYCRSQCEEEYWNRMRPN